jgi:hypothetical protein
MVEPCVFPGFPESKYMKHPTRVERYPGTLSELAEEIGNLRYDALTELLQALATKIERDGKADAGRGRVRLAESLHRASEHLMNASHDMEIAWHISKPHMNIPAEPQHEQGND